ncbi:DUF4055 domain-containing protein [Pasteurella multocida]|uniref:DUF4055 domain-containing protein n=1 Tax=Pasteurella multocida TaxID=747 RepID=UPI002A52EA4A|nr:DUF4055 domain-containing protein [Pasteurella multocida]MDY0489420.1 DUF4055 domain-containing protein [Pasteurella multocida]MDY0595959.1 DUF4055 domain-containing protein [Pasteurella multocida]MDY0665381.1 DUF4055 domain-containing protein [Pasteurella multocida]MDY0667482.1 DUF4055 domain-containing protein [Pasteurella multocida]
MFKVSDTSPEMAKLHSRVRIIDDLLGGTERMREVSKTYLPKFPLEDEDTYKNRLERTTLYPALEETLSQMNGRVFFTPINITKINNKLASEILPDVDMEGNNLDVFASSWFHAGLAYGVSYVLVDYPVTNDAKTLAEEKAMGARPYLVHIHPASVLDFKTARINGKRVFTQFRYREFVDEENGEFGLKQIEQINVYERGIVRKFRKIENAKDGDNDYYLHAEVELKHLGKALDFIPIVPFITKQSDHFGIGRPPLLELAHLNIKHWQSQSDQDNIVSVARVPILARTGAVEGERFQIGGSVIDLPREGSLFYVEHSGNAIGAGKESIKELESQMLVAGAKLLIKNIIAMTESQARDEQGKEISQLRLYANKFEDALDLALEYVGFWLGIENVGNVEISGNIDSEIDPNASLDMVIKLNSAGVISTQTTFEEAKRRGLLSDHASWEDEQARLEVESMSGNFHGENNEY